MGVEHASRIIIDVPLTIIENHEEITKYNEDTGVPYKVNKKTDYTYIICDSEYDLSCEAVYELAKICGLDFSEVDRTLTATILDTNYNKDKLCFDIENIISVMKDLTDRLKENGVVILTKVNEPKFYLEHYTC